MTVFSSLRTARRLIIKPTIRTNFQVVNTRKYDKETGKYLYQDWDQLVFQFKEPVKYDNSSLLQRHLDEEEHIKPTELKRRRNARVKYNRSVKKLEDLSQYINFMREHNDGKV